MAVRDYKMHGTKPRGRSRSYTYYATIRKVGDVHLSVPAGVIEEQITALLRDISIDPGLLPQLQSVYREHIQALKGPSLTEQVSELRARVERLHVEEAALARLYAQGKLTDKNYDALYREWQTKVFEAQQEIARLEAGSEEVLDDLDQALALLAYAPQLFSRLELGEQGRLLQILFRRIIIDTQGEVVDFNLNPPFVYLSSLMGTPPDSPPGQEATKEKGAGSRKFQSALPGQTRTARQHGGQFDSAVNLPAPLDWVT